MKLIKILDTDLHKQLKLSAVESEITIEKYIEMIFKFYKEHGRNTKTKNK
jgi:hypothetical protein